MVARGQNPEVWLGAVGDYPSSLGAARLAEASSRGEAVLVVVAVEVARLRQNETEAASIGE
jgi:hypothetical protein